MSDTSITVTYHGMSLTVLYITDIHDRVMSEWMIDY